jgi:hypothetical protein
MIQEGEGQQIDHLGFWDLFTKDAIHGIGFKKITGSGSRMALPNRARALRSVDGMTILRPGVWAK